MTHAKRIVRPTIADGHAAKRRQRATWVSRKEVDMFCVDFSGFEDDPGGLQDELDASDAIIRQQAPHSLRLAIDLHQARLTPALVGYLQTLAGRDPDPLYRVAVIGLSGWQRMWSRFVDPIRWPPGTTLFDDWEAAKAWLIGERG